MRKNSTFSLAMLIGQAAGGHPAAWLHPSSNPAGSTDIDYYRSIAQLAEQGLFDLFFIADTPAARTDNLHAWSRFPMFMNMLEPVTLLTGLAGATRRIGLGATVSTSFSEPYNVARMFASLDHISGGRAAWNVVTSANDYAARNFGHATLPPHALRYERAGEFVDVVNQLWDSWDDDAFIRDKASGQFFNPQGLHTLDHKGKFFTVRGPLNVPRSPQGRPVIVQAGGSEDMINVAAEFAEVIFCAPLTVEAGQKLYRDLKEAMGKHGRHPDEMRIMPGLSTVIGESESEAVEKYEELQSLIHPIVAREILGTILGGIDLSQYPFDGPVPEHLAATASSQYAAKSAIDLAKRENLSIRQLAMRMAGARGKAVVKGTPKQIADMMEEWFVAGAADGFNIMPPYLPGGLNDFVKYIVPELQRRGLFRTEYEGTTLRENLGLQRPQSRYKAA